MTIKSWIFLNGTFWTRLRIPDRILVLSLLAFAGLQPALRAQATLYGTGQADVVWQRTYDANDDTIEGLRDMILAKDGRIVALVSKGDDDVHLVKFETIGTPAGDIVWERSFGGAGEDVGQSLAQTDDDGFIITGHSDSFPMPGDSSGAPDVYLIKTDSNGELQWETTYGIPGEDRGMFVQQAQDGSFRVIATTGDATMAPATVKAEPKDLNLLTVENDGTTITGRMELMIGTGTEGSGIVTRDGGYFLYSNETRNLIRTYSAGVPNFNMPYREDMTNIIGLSGTSDASVVFTTNNIPGPLTALLVKLDAAGNIVWANGSFYEHGLTNPTAVIEWPGQGYIVGGGLASSLTPSNLIGTDELGEFIWGLRIDTGSALKTAGIRLIVPGQSTSEYYIGGIVVFHYGSASMPQIEYSGYLGKLRVAGDASVKSSVDLYD